MGITFSNLKELPFFAQLHLFCNGYNMFHGFNPYYYSAYHILFASQQTKSNRLSIDKRSRHFRVVVRRRAFSQTHPTVFQLPLFIYPFRPRGPCANEYLKYILLFLKVAASAARKGSASLFTISHVSHSLEPDQQYPYCIAGSGSNNF